jgi:predicted metal-dependent hydrolase
LYPKEYIQYLIHFHGDRDYFECHEILEEYWKGIDPGNKESVWVGLIQLAVSCYHHRRKNFIGAKKTLEKAVRILSNEKNKLADLGLNWEILHQIVMKQLSMIVMEESYKSFNLPLTDQMLVKECVKSAKKDGFSWGSDSDLTNISLVHRHKLRDRTYVIEERNRALNERKGNEE